MTAYNYLFKKLIDNMTPLKFLLLLIISFLVFLIALALYVNNAISYGMPSVEQLENPRQNLATQVLGSNGEVLDHFYIERRVTQPIKDIPQDFIHALISVEDRKFYGHWGVHATRVIKAMIKNILSGRVKEGASTITMQLARNLFINRPNTLTGKIREAFTAIQIEKTYTKDEILEMYANTVVFGRGAYGVEIASQVYFNKSASELTTAECAFLVGLLKAPENYNGIVDYEKAIERRNLVLNLMEEQGYLTNEQFIEAGEEPLNLATGSNQKIKRRDLAPHFVEMIRQNISKSNNLAGYDLYRDGLIIHTTLNSTIQKYAIEAVEEHLSSFQETFRRTWSWSRNQKLLNELITQAIKKRVDYIAAPQSRREDIERKLRNNKRFIDSVKNAATTVQVGLVVLDPTTGEILAMVGASPKFMSEHPDSKYSLNHATQIKRQPGSAFKPIVYASALQMGMTPSSMIECGPYVYKDPVTGEVWSPRGTGHCDGGEMVTLYQGLTQSINTVSARLITQVTNPLAVIGLASRMGIESKLHAVPALSLGAGGEIIPMELVSALGTFANQGIHVKPYAVTLIEDQFGNVLFEKKRFTQATDVVSKKIANQMTYMLQGVIDHGTAWRIRNYFKGCEAAGKTGTTNDFADAWFVGYTPQLVAGIWVGFDDRRVTFTGDYAYAATAAAPLWGRLMAKIYSDAKLPYRQKRFSFTQDSVEMVSLKNIDNIRQVNNVKPEISPKPSVTLQENKINPVAKPKLPPLPKAEADKKKIFNN